MTAQAPTQDEVKAQAGRVRRASKKSRDASRDLARESARLEDMLGVGGLGDTGIGIAVDPDDDTTTAGAAGEGE